MKNILDKHNYTCAMCGVKIDEIFLHVDHIVPLSVGGKPSKDKVNFLCSNCSSKFSPQPREIEFVNFVSDILNRHQDFSDVKQEVLLGRETRYRVDLLVNRRANNINEILLIECKTFLAFTSAHLDGVIAQLKKYKASFGDCRMVLAIPATLREADLSALNAANIEAWDLRYMASHFSIQIQKAEPSYYRTLLLTKIESPKTPTREQMLLNSLASCNPGRADCYVYQTLVGEILECLFTPPLGKPIPELSDKSKANRRDFIMPNYSEVGFWSFLRQKYEADYIVIDAKNYTRKVKKSEVLQIANYLKPHGAGLFGLIISRSGGDASGCEHTLREQWLVHRKLILVLDDEDIKAMLTAKSDGRPSEEILGQKIERFRLSM